MKKNFLTGLEIPSLAAVNHGVRHWLEHVVHVRRHAETRQTPMELFGHEVPQLRPANLQPCQASLR